MIESGFKRALLAFGIFLAGVHLVGLGIWNNGNAYSSNPTWNFIQNVWSAGLFILKIILGCLFVFILTSAFKFLASSEETKKSKSETEFTPKAAQTNIPSDATKHQKLPQLAAPVIVSPPPEPLSAEELKRKALKQIIGKEF